MRDARLLSLVSALSNPGGRREAARILACGVGAEDLVIFVPDLELGVLLPAPGFLQTLPDARAWQRFAGACQPGVLREERLPFLPEGAWIDATGIAGMDGSVLVLLGGWPRRDLVVDIGLLLPLLAAAMAGERNAMIAEANAGLAQQSANQAKLLAGSLEKARSALRRALSDAGNANRAKDRFLAALSHELRTPLTPVLMAAAALEADPLLPAAIRGDLSMIRRNVELEVTLIDDLLDLSRVIAGKLRLRAEPLELCTLVRNAREVCEPYLREKGIHLVEELPAGIGNVLADATRLQQVLWNLLKNAVKFTPEKGTITLSAERVGAGTARIGVRDTGRGIEKEALSRIFEAFEQGSEDTANEFGGLGMGLAISKAITKLHGGTIRAESAGLGRGATFIVELPLMAGAAEVADPAASVPSLPSPDMPARILIAEDHADTAQLLSRLLKRAGHHVCTAGTVAQALERLNAEPFDLLLSDVGLPDASGYELMQQAAQLHGLAGIAMSGYGLDEDIRRSQEAGFAEHLIKPLNVQCLKQAIQRVLARRPASTG